MKQCPVCNTVLISGQCPECGFDASRDYERWPTFAPLSGAREAVSRRRSARNGVMRCSKCGSAELSFRFADRNLSCSRCGHLLAPREMDTLLAIMGCTPLLHQTPQTPPPPKQEPKSEPPEKPRITAVAAGYAHTAVLYSDGAVRAVGLNRDGQCDTGRWKNIIAIAAGADTTVGLKADGTIVSTKHFNRLDHNCTEVASVAAGGAGIVCLRRDGTVVFPWSGISVLDRSGFEAVASSWDTVLGVKKEGNVVLFQGDGKLLDRVRLWTGISSAAAGFSHVAGLRRNGTVVCAGDNTFRQCDTDEWSGITAVCAGDNHTVGLRSDGTVVAAGGHTDSRCAVGTWKNVTAVSAGGFHTVALCADGRLLATGSNREGQCAIARLMADNN